MGTPCFDAMRGSSKSLLSLITDFGVCLTSGRTGYDSTLFPSLCGEGTSAVKGLEKIYSLASASTDVKSSTKKAILMVTDGIILDDGAALTKVLSNLNSMGIRTLIAAGFDGTSGAADMENLKLYTSDDNILTGTDPIQLGIDIVNKMKERGIVCEDHGNLSKIIII
jgi:hypothetical protein